MPRYIDLEAFAERIKKYIKPETKEEKDLIEWCKDECIRQGYCMPTADVVPKSEVDKMKIILATYGLQDRIRLAREIFAEIDGITDLFAKGLIGELEMYDKLAELKKKYTEGNP